MKISKKWICLAISCAFGAIYLILGAMFWGVHGFLDFRMGFWGPGFRDSGFSSG